MVTTVGYPNHLQYSGSRQFSQWRINIGDIAGFIRQELYLEGAYYTILIIEENRIEGRHLPVGYVSRTECFMKAVEETMRSLEGCSFFSYKGYRRAILVTSRTKKELEKRCMDLCRLIENATQTWGCGRVTIGMGTVSSRAEEAGAVLVSADKAMEGKYLYGYGQVYKAEREFGRVPVESGPWQEAVLHALQKNDIPQMEEQLHGFVRYLRYLCASEKQCRSQFENMIRNIARYMKQAGFGEHCIYREGNRLSEDILQDETIDHTLERVIGYCRSAGTELHRSQEGDLIRQIAHVTAYMEEHYMEPDLRLADISRCVSMSPTRLCEVFRRYKQESFSAALSRLRMEKAKTLLEQNLWKIREVAEKVGYRDPHSFGIAFKKYTGCTPSRYREQKYKAGN
ncbi:AraC family transcriptional regulator [Diplocloster hominis]|uniref:helix-turn-helix domain-containing protein n=1 Tax=Diplocloster hominis TaxID=3079010 RepID=UPI0031BA2B38